MDSMEIPPGGFQYVKSGTAGSLAVVETVTVYTD